MRLNFARSWRARTFDHIIGQELSVRVLKNSLYKNYFFPLYLLSGQRGSGKTSMARIFAAAINCEQLPLFQKNPTTHTVPCLSCISCQAMAHQNHPDFIEMDAASHTGVDNVRAIIDAASLLPVLGKKRIYLIDEAHMLSKAAFNAFLKILEEPPASVLFILATTDVHKIIDTIISRSFRLLLRPITVPQLATYLEKVCVQEQLTYDQEGLMLLAQEAQGSVRDALNVLEMIHLADMPLTATAVRSVLLHMDGAVLVQLLAHILEADYQKLCSFLAVHNLANYSMEAIWRSLVALVHDMLYLAHGVTRDGTQQLQELVAQTDTRRSTLLLQHLYEYDLLMQKSERPHQVFEMVLSTFCTRIHHPPSSSLRGAGSLPASAHKTSSIASQLAPSAVQPTQTVLKHPEPKKENTGRGQDAWTRFLSAIEQLNDPLLQSIFRQVHTVDVTTQSEGIVCTLTFLKRFLFFQELLDSTKMVWMPLLHTAYEATVQVKIVFCEDDSTLPLTSPPPLHPVAPGQASVARTEKVSVASKAVALPRRNIARDDVKKYRVLDISDSTKWQRAHMVLQFFPGTIYLA